MHIDPNLFFKHATLRICSSLDIEKALWHCLLYIKDFIPTTRMGLLIYDPATGVTESVANATPEGYERVSVKVTLSDKDREQVAVQRRKHVRRIPRVGSDHVASRFSPYFGGDDLPVLIMDLVIEGSSVGAVTLHGIPGQAHNMEHESLLRLLNEPFAIALTNSIRYQELQKYKDLLVDDNRYLQGELQRVTGEEVVGADFGLLGVMELVKQVAPLESPVLLLGETGVGKELIASTVHNLSPRQNGPFIKVNCGAIPDTLIDSELFGHEKGAFTGANVMKRGRFERANHGTIFLDEVAELSAEAQVRLLRVLQEKEIERVGGTETIKTDIRVIAATHRNLEGLAAMGRFRQDLLFRLKVFPILIPPLRERRDDIPSLVQHFIRKKSVDMKLGAMPPFAAGALENLMKYPWPGNVRELENAVERALILSGGTKPVFQDYEVHAGGDADVANDPDETLPTMDQAMADLMRMALKHSQGRVEGKGGAAELLGVHPMTLRNRMKKLGVPFGKKALHHYKRKTPITRPNWPIIEE